MDTQQAQLERYKGFLTQDPHNTNLICQVAQLQLQLGNPQEALDSLTNALNDTPGDAGLQFNLASAHLALNNFQQAVDLLSVLNESIDNSALKYNLGFALTHIGEHERAHELFKQIINAEDAPVDTSYWLGRSYYYLGDTENAEKYLSLHSGDHPENADALGTLALLSMDTDNFQRAKELAQTALSINSNNTEALVTMGNIFLDEQDEDSAFDYFSKASALQPSSGRAWSGLGLTNMLKQDLPSAIDDLKKATQFMPEHLGTWHALAWAQIVTNDIEGAAHTFESCLDIDRNFGETHGGLAVIDILQGNKESAKEKIKRALKLDKMSFSANFAQSLILQDSHPDQAIKIIDNIMSTKLAGDITLKETLNKHLRKHSVTKH